MTAQTLARPALPERSILMPFLLFVLVGGGASVAIRMTYAELAPFWAATSRFALAALVFWALVFFRKIPLPKGRALLGAVLFGALTVGLAFTLIGWGLVATPASRYQILMATVPLLTIFLSSLHGVEAISRRGLFGSLLAVGGIAFTVGGGVSGSNLSLPHIVAIILAAACLAEGGVLIKKFPPNPPIMTNAISMTVGAIILGIASLLSQERWNIPTQANTWIAFIYLVFFVTVVAFLLYLFVLGKWSASGTSYGFVLVPLVTILVASTLAGEEITWNFLIGAVLVLAGVLVGALLPSKEKPAAVDECKSRSGQVLPRCA
ncbi:MAG: EamA family transporter [Anaerolineales bacterium]|nr:MAG: EamA family transporter [Anaerolineales bacterium]